ncbi:cation:proton antiporter [[Limnothrix rosea] IAM M-220]|uniref:cation:proton antiporter n=1 Tax=[Limnothrix rosea] IAM M-220 TaxID=454133 RepID=UPI0009646C8D|nr:sodium:proton antiporter [[Limnothrix rosea] IAM M-220]OKH14648.1 sodium:proton antiporter [[Limnothrix rosea] IAM M-220]
MADSFDLTLQIIIAVFAGISAQVLGEFLKIPGIVLLLIFGIVLGVDGFAVLHPSEFGVGLEVLVALAVAIILFEGGLNLRLKELNEVSGSLRNLVTFGTLITLAGGGIAAHYLAEFPWPIAFLYAALVVVTGPTVVGPLLKQVAVEKKVATLLEGEGVLIDPVGAILAVVVLDTILNADAGLLEIAGGLILRLGIGTLIGAAGGWLMGQFLRLATSLSEDLKNLLVLASIWGLFGFAQYVSQESGLMAVVVAGIVLRALSIPEERLLRRFKSQLTVLCVSVLFILLAADLSLASIVALGWGSFLAVATLMFVVRPISVALCTANSDLSWRQKFFVAWVAPRGIVSASVASLFAIILTEQGFNGGASIKALVFLTILMTVFIQGLTAKWIARQLQITSSSAKGAVIVGSNPLSRIVAKIFQDQGESVVIVDTDAKACEEAKAQDLEVYQSSALNAEVLEEIGISSMGTFLSLTSNGEVNLVLAQRAVEEFQPPRVVAFFEEGDQNNAIANKSKIGQAFTGGFSVKTWNQYIRDQQVKLGKSTIGVAEKTEKTEKKTFYFQSLIESGELLPLLIKRDDNLMVMRSLNELQSEDELIYLLHDPRPQLLKRLSGGMQSSRLALEELPEVENFKLQSAPESDSQSEDNG